MATLPSVVSSGACSDCLATHLKAVARMLPITYLTEWRMRQAERDGLSYGTDGPTHHLRTAVWTGASQKDAMGSSNSVNVTEQPAMSSEVT